MAATAPVQDPAAPNEMSSEAVGGPPAAAGDANVAGAPAPSAAAAAASQPKRSPSDFLKSVMGRPVRVKLNSGIEYRGVLACLDGYLNIAMEQTEEYEGGQLKARYGDCFIRGNNVLYISTSQTKKR